MIATASRLPTGTLKLSPYSPSSWTTTAASTSPAAIPRLAPISAVITLS